MQSHYRLQVASLYFIYIQSFNSILPATNFLFLKRIQEGMVAPLFDITHIHSVSYRDATCNRHSCIAMHLNNGDGWIFSRKRMAGRLNLIGYPVIVAPLVRQLYHLYYQVFVIVGPLVPQLKNPCMLHENRTYDTGSFCRTLSSQDGAFECIVPILLLSHHPRLPAPVAWKRIALPASKD